jgi:HPt (histidine-containing phosphotransfer) domain-containing protein
MIHQWLRDKDKERQYLDKQKELYNQGNESQTNNVRIGSTRRSGIDRRSLGLGIAGLNLDDGIERFGGDEEIYFNVLRSYADNTPPLIESIKNVTEANLGDYAITVHGIKGSSQGICANEFAEIAYALEKAAKAGNYEFVVTHNEPFIRAAWKLLKEIDEMLLQIYADSPKPSKDKPDIVILGKLSEACVKFDMDAVDEAIDELESYEYDFASDNELVAWLRQNTDVMNFDEIVKRISDGI